MDEPIDFPDGENGDVSRRLQADGDHFQCRDVDFTVVFPTQNRCPTVHQNFPDKRHNTSVTRSEVVAESAWDVWAIRHMAPFHHHAPENSTKNSKTLPNYWAAATTAGVFHLNATWPPIVPRSIFRPSHSDAAVCQDKATGQSWRSWEAAVRANAKLMPCFPPH
jgi:hypothetical protein